MAFDPTNFMPFDLGKYLMMWFVSGGVIMVCFYFQELFARKDWLVLFGFAAALVALWHHASIEHWRLPGF